MWKVCVLTLTIKTKHFGDMRTNQNVLTVYYAEEYTHTHTHTHTHSGVHGSTHPWLILLHLYQNSQPRGVALLLFSARLILLSIIHVSYLCQTRRCKISGDQQKTRSAFVRVYWGGKKSVTIPYRFISTFSRPSFGVSHVNTRRG